MQTPLGVRLFASIAALDQFAEQIDALNFSSARPNPYLSARYLRCFAQHNEYFPDHEAIRLYTAWEGEQLIGCLPLRRVRDRFGPLQASRICFLAPFDIDQPGVLCAPENEERVARAFIEHIRDQESRFSMLEFLGQRPGSALHQVMHQSANAQFRARDIDTEPYNEIAVTWPHVESYFRALSSSWRRNVARCARLLHSTGHVEVVMTEGVQATSAWFDAYLDLETRSWKHQTSAAVARNTRRVELYRQLTAGQGGFTPSFIGILIDGFLVAGTLNGSNTDAPAQARGVWGLEMAYDASYSNLGPGLLLDLLLVHQAIQRQEKFVNLLHGFSDYKRRWKAEVITVKNVQLIRRWSLHNLRGTIGDILRPLRAKLHQPQMKTGKTSSENKPTEPTTQTTARPDRTQAKRVTAQALAYTGPGIQRLSFAQLCKLVPLEAKTGH